MPTLPLPEAVSRIKLEPLPETPPLAVSSNTIDDTTLDNTLLETLSRFILFALVSKGLLNIQAPFISG
jgi:hypothetical protein